MCYSLWCNAHPTMLPAEGRQHRGVCITPQGKVVGCCEHGYNSVILCDITSAVSDILWYQLILH